MYIFEAYHNIQKVIGRYGCTEAGMFPFGFKTSKMLTKKNMMLLAFLAIGISVFAQQSDTHLNYLNAFKDIAIREMERAGIPASIKLAQGLLESNAGQSSLARRANNHFGMKCGSNWQGDTMYKEDDDYDENGRLIKSCFRAYKNGPASYVAHSEFLRDPRKAFRYGFLFRLSPTDYKGWAFGLKQAGYATSPTYPEKLISLIERYELYQYDTQSIIDVETPGEVVTSGILQNNDVRYIVVGEGESLDDISHRVDINVNNLLNYNESINRVSVDLPAGERVYLQPKRRAYRGKQKYHTVEPGQTMASISQLYAVQLKRLYKRNRLTSGEEAAPGEQIKLRGWKIKETPRLASSMPEIPSTNPANNLPAGELEMEEPDEEETMPTTKPVTPQPTTTTPSAPTSPPVGTQGESPVIIINPGSKPVSPPPSTTNPTSPPVTSPTTGTPTEPTTPPTTSPTTPVGGPVYHVVQQGDTLWSISKRYDTTVDAIKQLNGLNSNSISLGVQLRVK